MNKLLMGAALLASLASLTAHADDTDPVGRGEAIAKESGCAGCHTPPGGAPYTGYSLGGWVAYNITADPVAGIGDWSDDELLQYFRTGHVNGKAQAAGPMAEIIVKNTAPLGDEDLRALVAYLRSIPAANPEGETQSRSSYGEPAVDVDRVRGLPFKGDELASGARLYLGNCASCHGADGQGSSEGYYPSLVNNSAVGAATPDNLVNVILHGVSRKPGDTEYFMPRFAGALTDGEVVSLSSYVLRRFGRGGIEVKLEDVASRR